MATKGDTHKADVDWMLQLSLFPHDACYTKSNSDSKIPFIYPCLSRSIKLKLFTVTILRKQQVSFPRAVHAEFVFPIISVFPRQ